MICYTLEAFGGGAWWNLSVSIGRGMRAWVAGVKIRKRHKATAVFLTQLFAASFILVGGSAAGEKLVASVPLLPKHSELDYHGRQKGRFVELVKAMDRVYREGSIEVNVFPFKRSIANAISGRADFHLPLIRTPFKSEDELPYHYVSEPITQVAFVAYSLADKPVISDLSSFDGLSTATLRGHSQHFPFPIKELGGVEIALKMLASGREFDAVILEQEAADGFIRKHQIKNVRRQLYRHFDSSIVIPKGSESEVMDKLLSSILKQLKSDQQGRKLIDGIHRPYDDWQPTEMGWE